MAEKAGLDHLFPENPLSQAREFVKAVTEDLLPESVENDERENPDAGVSKQDEQEILKEMFGDKSRRKMFRVKVGEK